MAGFDCLLVLVAVFQVITSQEYEQGPPPGPPPEWANHKCARPPQGIKHPQNCCEAKQMFTEEEMSACGIEKLSETDFKQGPPKPPDCSKQECLLKSKGLLNEDNSVNREATIKHINDWADGDFEPIVKEAAAICLGDRGVPGPPHVCEANRLMFCVGGYVFYNCPQTSWKDTDDCKRLKEHMDECKAFKPSPPN